MTTFEVSTHSLRALRLRALAPRLLLYGLVLILSAAGVKGILAGPVKAPPPARVVSATPDYTAMTFADSFARAYLTWSAADPTARQQQLVPYLSQSMDPGAGLTPATGTSQSVYWATVAGETSMAGGVAVTVAAQTNHGLMYLNVPVARDSSGSMAIDSEPALVGPPPTDTSLQPTDQVPVQDGALTAVVQRALTNYLSGASTNLAADLAPGAVTSVPAQPLHLQQMGTLNWVQQGSEVSAQVTATDSQGNAWGLNYHVRVVDINHRWYIRSIQVDPTSEGGT